MGRQIKRGPGWRLGWNPEAAEFRGLIGGDEWAIELTESELDDFCRLLLDLTQTMEQIAEELMDEEAISCEVESEQVWLEAEGYAQAYSVRVLLLTGRGAEGFWSADAVPGLVQAAQVLKVF